jgi:uncharacterized protein
MRCPVDNETLVMADRNGVEIDYCPKCRGVWLDRGELDKILERNDAAPAPVRAAPARPSEPEPVRLREPEPPRHRDDDRRHGDDRPRYRDDDDDDDRRKYGHSQGYPRKRKESFLSDLFDF